jgi:hypothetical protein
MKIMSEGLINVVNLVTYVILLDELARSCQEKIDPRGTGMGLTPLS